MAKVVRNKKYFVFVIVFSLLLSFFVCVEPVRADPIAYSFAQGFGSLAQAYGMQAGASIGFDNSSTSDFDTFYGDKLDLWQASKAQSDPNYTAKSAEEWLEDNIDDVEFSSQYAEDYSVYNPSSDPALNVPGYRVKLSLGSSIATELADFWSWLLEDLGFSRNVTGDFTGQGGSWDSSTPDVTVSTIVSGFASVPYLPSYSASDFTSSGIFIGYLFNNSGYGTYALTTSSTPVYLFFVDNWLYCVSYGANSSYKFYQPFNGYESQINCDNRSYFSQYNVVYGAKSNTYPPGDPSIPVYSSLEAGIIAFASFYANGAISSSKSVILKPYDYTDALNGIRIPDTTSQDYVPEAVETVIGIPWDDLYNDDPADVLPLVAPVVASKSIDDVEPLELAEALEQPVTPSPGEVYIPFLPVNLPSFNFSLSGIWYYVVRWVNSLRPFWATLTAIWAVLPAAMVYPVFGSAVCVIVIGVYRRFFM